MILYYIILYHITRLHICLKVPLLTAAGWLASWLALQCSNRLDGLLACCVFAVYPNYDAHIEFLPKCGCAVYPNPFARCHLTSRYDEGDEGDEGNT